MSKLLLRCIRRNNLYIYVQLRHRSTKPVVKHDHSEQNQKSLKDFEKLSNIYRREVKLKPQKPPFAKNLFLGVFDTNILTYPEVLDNDELNRLNKYLKPIESFFDELTSNEGKSCTLKEFMERARYLQVFGLQASQLAGGKELNVTEVCRFNEAAARNHGDVSLVKSEQLGLQTLLKLGTEKQQVKYLEAFTSGNVISAFCMGERNTSDTRKIESTAVRSGEFWILNGEKSWVVNGSLANLFVVFAQTEAFNKAGLKENKLSAFFVERSFGGVSSKPAKMLGLHQTDISNVTFRDTKIPVENVIGILNHGEEIFTKIFTNYRLSTGTACSGISKILLNKFISHCKDQSDEHTNLMEMDMIHEKISEIATSLYAMESITYLTAALIDQYEDQDCELESAIVKAFSAEHCHKSTQQCMNFIGSPAYSENHWCNELHRNSLGYLILDEPIDTLKIVIALQGLQHAGHSLQDKINVLRNPMFNAFEMFKRMFTQRRNINDNPKLTLGLENYLHPSLTLTATRLEYCVHRLQYVTELLLTRYGADITTKHMDLRRLADCILDVYAMTAVLGRASRSYCIGLRHSDYEIVLANAFCLNATERVNENARKIFIGPYNTNDGNYNEIGPQLFNVGQYFAEHPLTKNF